MGKSELINEILLEWALRVDNGTPDVNNKIHIEELKQVLSEMGLSEIGTNLIYNLTEADGKEYTNPILNKVISYKTKKGETKTNKVGNLLRLRQDDPGRIAAERALPAEGTPERDGLDNELGIKKEKPAEKPEAPAAEKPEAPAQPAGGEQPNPEAEKQKQQQAMFTGDPGYKATRLDPEKAMQAKIDAGGGEDDNGPDGKQFGEPGGEKKEPKSDFQPIDAQDVHAEMPQSDPDVFSGQSDLDKIDNVKKHQISMKIDELAKMAADAKAKGEKAPTYNLCEVTVPGTNLYCDDNLGIPRDQMPQFKGKPQPGTPSVDLPRDKNGEVDTEPLFKKMLADKGIKVVDTEIPSDALKASQSELVGTKVAGMAKALEENPNNPGITAPIYVSRDGYVIDGHHRWAAVTSAAIAKGAPANMKVHVIDMDAKDIIPMANQFAQEQGIQAKSGAGEGGNVPNDMAKNPVQAKSPEEQQSGGKVYAIGGGYYSDTPDGPAKYVKAESVVEKALIDEDVNALFLMFEATVTKTLAKSGKTVKLKVLSKKEQDAANKKAKETSGGKTPVGGKAQQRTKAPEKETKQQPKILAKLNEQELKAIENEYVSQKGAESAAMADIDVKKYGKMDMAQGYSDDDYYSKGNGGRGHSTAVRKKPFYFPTKVHSQLKDAGFPEKYIKFLERCVNTQVDDKLPPVTELIDTGGAGQIQSQFGEVMAMAFISIRNPQDRYALANLIRNEIKTSVGEVGAVIAGTGTEPNGKSWVDASLSHAEAFDSTMDEKYGKGKWQYQGASWDIKKDVEALGLDYKNKGFSTDIILRVQPLKNGKPFGKAEAQRCSLKKDEAIMFFNGSVNEVENFILNYISEKDRNRVRALESLYSRANSNVNTPDRQAARDRIMKLTGSAKWADGVEIVKQKSNSLREEAFSKAPKEVQSVVTEIRNFPEKQKKSALELAYFASVKMTPTELKNAGEAAFKKAGDRKFAMDSHKIITKCAEENGEVTEECVTEGLKKLNPKKANLKYVCKACVFAAKLAKGGGYDVDDKLKGHLDLAKKTGNDLIKAIPKSKELLGGVMQKLAEAFPLKVCMEGTEYMEIDGVHVTDKTLKGVFGVNSYDELQKGLTVIEDENGDAVLVFQMKGKGKPKRIGYVNARQKGGGYEGTIGFEILCDDEFVYNCSEANSKNGDTSSSNAKAHERIGKTLANRAKKAKSSDDEEEDDTNESINEAAEDDVMNKKVKYKDKDGKDKEVLVKTALQYANSQDAGQKSAYQAAQQMIAQTPKAKEPEEPKQPTAQKPAEKPAAPKTEPAAAPVATKTEPTAEPEKPKEKSAKAIQIAKNISNKIKDWSNDEKEFFKQKVHKGNSPVRRELGQAIKDKAKGAWHAVKKGLQHEGHIVKDAATGARDWAMGKPINDHQKKALKEVGKKVAVTAIFALATGGTHALAHGALGFAKHVAAELVPHAMGEVLALGVGSAALHAGVERMTDDDYMQQYCDRIADYISSMKITPEMMEQMVDSYNQKKEEKKAQYSAK